MSRSLLFSLGRPFSPLYSMAMHLRSACYRQGLFRTHRLGVPVVSVGNLTMGGTGKTPMVRHLARLLLERGRRPAIVSRGYGGTARAAVNTVSDGSRLLMKAGEAGDEPYLLARSLPGVPVLTGAVRRLPAAEAVRLGADCLLLDDGFQHLAVARDLDLVLFNADRLAGNSRVFPGGDLREPVAALKRCHAFVLTSVREQNQERADRFAGLLRTRFPGKAVWQTGYLPGRWSELESRELAGGSETLPGTRGYAFCGIAHPEAFSETLESMGITPAGFSRFPDHCVYTAGMMEDVERKAGQVGADMLLTTEKDMVKLFDLRLRLPCYALGMEVHAPDGFGEWVAGALG